MSGVLFRTPRVVIHVSPGEKKRLEGRSVDKGYSPSRMRRRWYSSLKMMAFVKVFAYPCAALYQECMQMDKKLYSLQALRALGSIAVVLFHADGMGSEINMKLGASGVDLFFIISGVVMYLSTPTTTDIGYFAWRRLVRIVPLYWVMTLATIAYYHTLDVTPSFELVVSSLFFVPSAHPGELPLLYPGWSLNYELFFYFVICLSLLAKQHAFAITATVVTLLGVLSGSVGIPYLSYYCIPGLLEFALGIGIGAFIKRGVTLNRNVCGAMLVAGVVALSFRLDATKGNPFIELGLPWAMVLVGLMGFETSSIVRSKTVQMLGDASYSIYLAHPFAIWLFVHNFSFEKGLMQFVMAVSLSIIFGIALHFLVEKPMTRAILSLRRRPTTPAATA